jgi:putative nucleotidyltransferase with HDIG domain
MPLLPVVTVRARMCFTPDQKIQKLIDFSVLVAAPGLGSGVAWDPVERWCRKDILEDVHHASGKMSVRRELLDQLSKRIDDPNEITSLVTTDSALASMVLKTVNSPFYGLRSRVGSVFRAVLLLGYVEVRNICWRAYMGNGFGADAAEGTPLWHQWRHSFAVSRVAYAIAKANNLPHADEISTAGLLHDVSKLLCLNIWPDRSLPLYGDGHYGSRDLLLKECDWFNVDHSWLSAEITRNWGLPGDVCSIIENHHAPSYVEPLDLQVSEKGLAAVHMADVLCHLAENPGQDNPSPVYRPMPEWFNRALVNRVDELENLNMEDTQAA